MSDKRHAALPPTLAPRGLSRPEAAAYIGVGVTLFDVMVDDCRMPKPKQIGGRRVWDRFALDTAFAALPGGDDANPWDTPYDRWKASQSANDASRAHGSKHER